MGGLDDVAPTALFGVVIGLPKGRRERGGRSNMMRRRISGFRRFVLYI